jgi:predicted alpha/beta-hydrolase family hydrolase
MRPRSTTFEAGRSSGPVSALVARPKSARVLLVLAHGAGVSMRHRFMETVAQELADRDIATFRYQFPYMEAGRRRPDAPAVLEETVESAVKAAAEEAPDLPLIAGGKSLGGRMTSIVQARNPLPGVQGLVFLAFPLHPPDRPDSERAAHLKAVKLPMLFLQGTRDPLADLSLVKPVCRSLGKRATLHVVEGGDHSFQVLKRSGRDESDVMGELADTILTWSARVL